MPYHTFGLDLGQAQDYSALVLTEGDGEQHSVVGLQRWPLGTPYTQIISDTCTRVAAFDMPTLVVDRTGVGRPIVEFLLAQRPKAHVKSVLIHGGHQTNVVGDSFNVPKKELVAVLQTLLQQHKLKIGEHPFRDVLLKEMADFKVKITTAGKETFEAWREGAHDDMVLALALAAWWAVRHAGPAQWHVVEPRPAGAVTWAAGVTQAPPEALEWWQR